MKIKHLLFALLFVTACNDDSQKQVKNHTINVDINVAQAKDIPLELEFSGRVQGSKEVEVRSRVSGILLKRDYVEGMDVKEGQTLFEIDPAPYQATLNQANANYLQQKAQLEASENQYKRMSILFEDRIVSAKALDDAKATLNTIKASIAAAKASVESAQLNLDWTKVKAPISGITSMEAKSEGSLISNTDLLTNITQLNPVYVLFSVTDTEMQSLSRLVEKGMVNNPNHDGQSDIVVKIKFDDNSFYPIEGILNFTNAIVDQATGTVASRAVFENPNKKIMPGQFVRIVIEGLSRLHAITIPKSAVMQGANGQFVYVMDNQGLAQVVPVVTGLSGPDDTWIIDKGLKNGDKVITSSLMKIKPNTPVKQTDTK